MKVDAVVGDATPKEKRSSSSSSAIVWVGCLGGEGREARVLLLEAAP